MPERIPPTAAQLAIWQACRLDPAVPMSISSYVEVTGDLDLELLRQACLVTGRELSSGFVRMEADGDRLWQVVEPSSEALECADLRGEVDPEAAAREWMRAETGRRVDIFTDRLVTMAVLRVANRRWFWFLRAHHIVMDGYAAITLLNRAAAHYTAGTGGQPVPESAADLRGLVEYDLAYRGSGRFGADRAYWLERLAGYRQVVTPARRSAPPAAVSTVSEAESPGLDSGLAAAVERWGEADSVVCIAAFAVYLARVTGTTEVTLSLPVAARTTAVLRRSAGMVSNVAPLRLRIGYEATIAQVLHAVRVAVSGALRHQRYRCEDMRRETGGPGSFGPLVNVLPLDGEIQLGSATGQLHVLSTGPVDDLAVNFHRVAGQRYRVVFETNPQVYDEDTAHRQHRRFLEFLERFLTADGEDPAWAVPLLDTAERTRILIDWNATTSERPVYVLDSRLQPVPVGVPGELYVAGAQLARGYADRAGVTADRFVASPFGVGERMYRTGDLVQWRELDGTGVLDLLGRTDYQVRLHGLPVDLGALEEALTTVPGVRHTAVAVVPSDFGDRLVAYVVPAPGWVLDADEVRAQAARVLPAQLVPSSIVWLEALPTTARGTLDRRALPRPEFTRAVFRAPSTHGERVIAEIFGAVLDAERVGADDDFFELGGNSLAATRVLARAEAMLGQSFPARLLYEARTVARIAAALEIMDVQTSGEVPAAALPALTAGARPDALPLSYAQQRMWLISQFDPASAAYNIPIVLRLTGALDITALRQAAADLVARHEVLRTEYPLPGVDAESPIQRVLEPGDVTLDLSPVPITAERVLSEVHRLATLGFDVTTGVPLRAKLFELGDDEFVLVLVVHHIVMDGWSLGPLSRDLILAYTAHSGGQAPRWEPLPVQYADFALWQRELLGSGQDSDSLAGRQLSYWRTALAGLPDQLALPSDRPRPPVQSFAGGRADFTVSAVVHRNLLHLARAADATLFMVLHAAFAAFLARLSGTGDIVIGTPVAGRGRAELDDLVGMFVNTLALRTRVRPETPFAQLLSDVAVTDLEAFAHSDVPFEWLVEDLDPPRSAARHPLFQVLLTLDSFTGITVELPDLTISVLEPADQPAKFDLTLSIREEPGSNGEPAGLSGHFAFARDLFDDDTVAILARGFTRLLEAITDRPERPVGDLELPGAAEYDRPPRWTSADRTTAATPGTEAVAAFRAPATPMEQIVAQAFSEVLDTAQVGADDDFFALGGNSVMATRLLARIGAATGTRLPVRLLFEAGTVALLAERVAAQHGGGRVAPVAGPRPELIPLAAAQRRMWLLNQVDPADGRYNIAVAVRLTGELDTAALRSAVRDVIARHEVLRTIYPPDPAGLARQQILPVEHAGVTMAPEPVAAEELPARLAEIAARGFDVATEMPLCTALLEISSAGHPAEFILVCVAHHIAADGWSMGPLTRDVMLAYAARAAGAAPGWEPLPVQYADYTLWHHETSGSADDPGSLAAAQLEFWRAALADLPVESTFPGDRDRPRVLSPAGAAIRFKIDTETARGLDAVAEAQGVTVFMIVHAALAILLARLSGAADVAIGAPVAGRGEAEFDDLIGMFVNTVVLRSSIDPAEPFAALLARQRETDLAAFAHADLPFDEVVEALAPERSTARTPLFQVALAFQNLPEVSLELAGLRADVLELPRLTEKFDMTVTVTGGGDAMTGEISYARDLFDEETARRIGDRLLLVLAAVTADPDVLVGDLDTFLDGERDTLLATALRPGIERPGVTLTDLVDERRRRHPDAIAIRAGDETLTYAMLSRRADHTARRLIEQGIGPGALVAVALERTVDMPVALLAVLRAGAAYLPIDPAYPAGRIEFVLTDAAPGCVVTSEKLRSTLPLGDLPVVEIETGDSAAEFVATRPYPDDLAYVIYTSGSTGTPKGVQVTHRNVVHLLTNTLPLLDLGPDEVWTVFHSFAFDFAVWELWGALCTGATAVIVDHMTSRSPDRFRDLLIREHVTVLSQTPSAFHQLDAADRDAAAGELGLRYVVFGGEALHPQQLGEWFGRHRPGSPELINMYGITETTVHVTAQPIDSPDAPGSVIGHGLPGVGVVLLDDRLSPVPAGVTGEMYVTGTQAARGYRGRPGLTATRFVANPFGPPGSRMYRSGDLGRWRGDRLEYLGRADDQVQLRGFRIELGEIEAVLAGQPGVSEARVIVRENRLLAYVRTLGETGDLYEGLGVHLPQYMIPAAITPVESWPLTVNGKLDVRALPAPDFTARSTGRAPRTEREIALAAIFAEVLGLPAVGAEDDFFTMGGDSLGAVRLRSRIREVLGEDVTVQEVFEARTVALLAATPVRRAELPTRAATRPAEVVPLSFPQRHLLELNDTEPALSGPGRTYVFALRLSGPIRADDVRQAVVDLCDRHEILRTVFPGYQQLMPSGTVDYETVLSEDPKAAMAACADRGFDLRTETPLRVRLYPAGSGDAYLLIMLHHMAADGWSAQPLIHDLATALLARTTGTAPDLPPLPIQYAAHAAWQQRMIDGIGHTPPIDRQLGYWTTTLAGLPELPAFLRRPESATPPLTGQIYLGIDEAGYHRLEETAAAHDASVYMVVHTAFAAMLREFGLGDDLAVCAPTAGRTEPGMESAIGRFTNFLVLRTDLTDAPDFPTLLDRVRRTTLAALDNQDLPFEFLTEHLKIRDRLGIRLAFQNIPTADLERTGLPAQWIPLPVDAPADFDLSLVLFEVPDDTGRTRSLWGRIEYATDVFDAETVTAMRDRFERLLPGQPISRSA